MKKPKNPAYPLSIEDTNKLINGLFSHGKYKHAAYVALACTLGLRYSDTSKLTWNDILKKRGKTLKVIEQKTGKVVDRQIKPELHDFIDKCFTLRKANDADKPILTSQMGDNIISIQSMNMTAKNKWIDLYDLDINPKNFSQHTFRKSAAMRVYESGGLPAAKTFLNHASLQATSAYLLISESELNNVIKNTDFFSVSL